MFQVPSDVAIEFERRMEKTAVPSPGRPDYRKGLRLYLDCCRKSHHAARSASRLDVFLAQLSVQSKEVLRG